MSNLDRSAKVISTILARLLENGLQESWLKDSDLDLPPDELVFVKTCFEWLVSEGLVRYQSDVGSDAGAAWINPVLTARGFAVLGTKLKFDGVELTVAEIVERKEAIGGSYSKIGEFLGAGLGGFIKSMGSS